MIDIHLTAKIFPLAHNEHLIKEISIKIRSKTIIDAYKILGGNSMKILGERK